MKSYIFSTKLMRSILCLLLRECHKQKRVSILCESWNFILKKRLNICLVLSNFWNDYGHKYHRVYHYHNIFTNFVKIIKFETFSVLVRWLDLCFLHHHLTNKTRRFIIFAGKYKLISEVGHHNCSKGKLIIKFSKNFQEKILR